jgi:3',5'-cyclic AMP phosphodiesterase CpdA
MRWMSSLSVVAVTAAIGLAAAGSAAADAGGLRLHGRAGFTLAAAGDIACTPGETGVPPDGEANGPDNCQQAQTAALVEALHPDAVAIPGDIQYQFGRLTEFLGSFDPTWGAFKSTTYPAPGNHEWYDSPNGQGYFDYFDGIGQNDGRAGVRGEGYYSVDLTRHWHLITLNSNCTSDNVLITAPVPCSQGSAQERWLRRDLAEHRGMCIIAQWHHPYFTSGPNGGGPNDNATLSFWRDLYRAHATLVLNGHDHGYERFAPQTPDGVADPMHGVREFVLGTGGKSLFGNATESAPNSQIYNDTAFGITLFTLYPHGYEWTFYPEPVAGNPQFIDHGFGRCNAPGGHDGRE